VLALVPPAAWNGGMIGSTRSRSAFLTTLRAHGVELRAHGVASFTLFGSSAHGDATRASDVDLAVSPGPGFPPVASIVSADRMPTAPLPDRPAKAPGTAGQGRAGQ